MTYFAESSHIWEASENLQLEKNGWFSSSSFNEPTSDGSAALCKEWLKHNKSLKSDWSAIGAWHQCSRE